MADVTFFPAFIRAVYEDDGRGFPAFQRAAENGASHAERVLTDAFNNVGRFAERALSRPFNSSGALDLDVAGLRSSAEAAQLRADAYTQVAQAAELAANDVGDLSEQTRRYIQSARGEASTLEASAQALRLQADAASALQAQLNRLPPLQSGVARAMNAMATASAASGRSSSAQRQALMQVGQQVQDFGIQIAGGTSFLTAFTQQASQAAIVAQGLEGVAGKVAGFFAGPWGTAILLGTSVLTLLEKSSKDAGDAHRDHADAASLLAKSIEDLDRKTKSAIATQQRELFLTQAQAQADLQATMQKRALIAAQLGQAKAQLTADKADTKSPDINRQYRIQEATRAIPQLDAQLAANDAEITKAQANAARAQARVTQQLVREGLDPAAAASGRYERAVDLLNRKLEQGRVSTDEYRAEYTRLTQQHEQAVNGAERASSSNGRLAASHREAADAARDATKAERELDQALRSIQAQFDAPATATQRYHDAFENIGKLRDAGKLNPDDATRYSSAAGIQLLEDQAKTWDRHVRDTFEQLGPLWQDALERPLVDVGDILEREMGRGAQAASKELKAGAFDAVQAFSQIIGNRPAAFLQTIGNVQGISTEQLIGRIGKEVFGKDLAKQLGTALTDALGGAMIGQSAGGMILGGKNSAAGSAVGGALGKIAGQELAKGAFGKALGSLSGALGPLGSIAGGVLGGLVGGLFTSTPKASATIGGSGNQLVISSLTGNKANLKQAASSSADSAITTLERLADQLGVSIDASRGSVSIGVRKGNYRVDTTGQGITKTSKGAIDFGEDATAAVKAATMDLIRDGVLVGLRASTQRLLTQAKDLDTAIDKAVKFEGVFSALKAIEDPVGAAIDAVDKQFTNLRNIFAEAGASAEELAKLEKYYGYQRTDAVKQASEQMTSALKGLLGDLMVGDNGKSLNDRLSTALATYNPLASDLAAGKKVDYDAFAEAARTVLDIQRQLSGSQDDYFKRLDEVTNLTQKALQDQENIIALSSAKDPVISSTGSSAGANDNTPVVNALAALGDGIADVLSNQVSASINARLDAVNQNLGLLIAKTGAGGSGGALSSSIKNF